MFLDARDLEDGATITTSVCIVGAGAAGITIARDLGNIRSDVVVLESGREFFDFDTQQLYDGVATGTASVELTDCRLRALGGTTRHWSGWCRRLDADDFEARDWLPGSGWPLSLADLDPYYQRAYETVEIDGEFDPQVVSASTGRPLLPLDPARLRSIVYRYSPPTRFHVAYRSALEDAVNVRVYLSANLLDIRLGPNGDRVEELQCRTLTGRSFTVRASNFVLAMGGIENARMLLASNSQQPDGVGNGSDWVGRCFMEHPLLVETAYLLLHPSIDMRFYVEFLQSGAKLRGAMTLPVELRQQEQLLAASFWFDPFDVDQADELGFTGQLQARKVAAFLRTSEKANFRVVNISTEQRPTMQSRVTLSSELDPLGIPRVHVNWHIAEEDFAGVGRALQWLGQEVGRLGVGRLWTNTDAEGQFRPGHILPVCHHMGTTRMSLSPQEGVVDRDCRVHGLPNLFIAGSSVFPTGGFANPTLTICALAHRIAEQLGRRA